MICSLVLKVEIWVCGNFVSYCGDFVSVASPQSWAMPPGKPGDLDRMGSKRSISFRDVILSALHPDLQFLYISKKISSSK